VYKSFVIAGLGTLGGFLADSLSRLDETEELTLIDFDTVEWKNLGTSIYRPIDVGVKKVTALTDIIIHQNPGVVVKSIDDTFIEGETKIPEGDIVFDCRDIICDRKDIIDVRVSISSRYVIVDCRKNVSYKEQKDGRYLVDLRKDDIRNAAFIVSMLVSNQTIRQLIKTQSIQKYELDYLKKIEPKYDVSW
jgi:molybdopterin/thiamine biosynthesis adenylyltransferase